MFVDPHQSSSSYYTVICTYIIYTCEEMILDTIAITIPFERCQTPISVTKSHETLILSDNHNNCIVCRANKCQLILYT